jgi:hypothetical protein
MSVARRPAIVVCALPITTVAADPGQDGGPYRRCRSPLRYWVPVGRHVLRVRAIGLSGLRGPAAVARFVVERNPNFR